MNLLWMLTPTGVRQSEASTHYKLSEMALILTVLGKVELSLSTLISNDAELHVRW